MSEPHADALPPAGLLRSAAKLVERVLIQLDTHADPCVTCGKREWRNPHHARLYERLTDTPERLRAAADALDGQDSVDARRSGNRL